jgi:hypothetical protein
MPAIKSHNRTNAAINRNFVIRVLEDPSANAVKKTRLTSANKLKGFVNDDKIVLGLFDKVLSGGKDKYTFMIRKRLKIDFHSK